MTREQGMQEMAKATIQLVQEVHGLNPGIEPQMLEKQLDERLSHGGAWLGVVRGWIQTSAWNGETVIWGTDEMLRLKEQSVRDMEWLARKIARAAILEEQQRVEREARIQASLTDFRNPVAARIAELTAENERLREALESIVNYENECIAEGVPCRLSNGEYDRARAALQAMKEAGR